MKYRRPEVSLSIGLIHIARSVQINWKFTQMAIQVYYDIHEHVPNNMKDELHSTFFILYSCENQCTVLLTGRKGRQCTDS